MKFKRTAHLDVRSNQRGISNSAIDMTLRIGEINGDKFITTKKLIQSYLVELDMKMKKLRTLRNKFKHLEVVNLIIKAISACQALRQVALKIMDKGGVTVVCAGNSLITTYNTNSFNRY